MKYQNLILIIGLLLVGCTAHDAVPGPQGPPGQSCSVASTPLGALITCPDNTQAFVFNGEPGNQGLPGTNGSSCSVEQTDSSATVTCTDGTSATVNSGTSCSVTQTDTGATINCSDGSSATIENGTTVTIHHGK